MGLTNSTESALISSVEILEKTRISRATLNNYIKLGIIPRPVVKKPDNPASRAKKIGYFPQDVIDCISTVQRMKEEGKSMEFIVKTLSRKSTHRQHEPIENRIDNQFRQYKQNFNDLNLGRNISFAVDRVTSGTGETEEVKLSINEVKCPAFFVNHKFEIEWASKDAELKIFCSDIRSLRNPADRNIFKLFSKRGFLIGDNNNNDLVTYMMKFVKYKYEKNLLLKFYNGILGKEVNFLEKIYDQVEPLYSDSLHETYLNVSGPDNEIMPYHAYHLIFREGILCILAPMDSVFQGIVELLSRRGKIIHDLLKQRTPALISFCVLVADLQDSSRICAELPPEEYFELIRDIWKCTEGSFHKYYGTYGKHVGDGMVYYFLKNESENYIMNSIYCAIDLREKMKKLNMDWKVRKGWLNDLYLNIGINEGQEYFGNIPLSPNIEFTALGDSVNYAGRLSDLARFGSIWTTKNLVNRLDVETRKKIQFGIKRKDHERERFIENMFSRVMDMLRPDDHNYSKFMDIATLSITEIISASPE